MSGDHPGLSGGKSAYAGGQYTQDREVGSSKPDSTTGSRSDRVIKRRQKKGTSCVSCNRSRRTCERFVGQERGAGCKPCTKAERECDYNSASYKPKGPYTPVSMRPGGAGSQASASRVSVISPERSVVPNREERLTFSERIRQVAIQTIEPTPESNPMTMRTTLRSHPWGTKMSLQMIGSINSRRQITRLDTVHHRTATELKPHLEVCACERRRYQ